MDTRNQNLPTRVKAEGDYRHGDLRNALLDAAGALVAERGAPAFSLREIASSLGVRHAAVYRHFASREALLSAVAARAFERMASKFEAVASRCSDDPSAHIEGLADAYLSMVRDEAGAYRLMFASPSAPDAARETAGRKCFELLHAAIAAGQRAGVVRGDLPAIAIAASNWAALHGLSMLLLDHRLDEDGPVGGSRALAAALRTIQREGWLRDANQSKQR